MDTPSITRLEENLRYTFSDKSLAETALRHRSYVHEQPEAEEDNERLEFLGDAVLNLIVSHLLMERFSGRSEGDLSRMRASLVNEKRLASVAKGIELGDFIRLGRGERQSSGRKKLSILADALEALIAAVYLDGGFDRAFDLIAYHFSPHFDILADSRPVYDYKSRLQELVQNRLQQMPVYEVTGQSGPDHDKTFTVVVRIESVHAEGSGKSKKAAEQDAAKNALVLLQQ